MLSKTIDGLFIATRYLVWMMGVLGIFISVILTLVNVSNGINAVLLFIATLLLSIAITLLLMPNQLLEKNFIPVIIKEKRFTISIVLLVVALGLSAFVYFIGNVVAKIGIYNGGTLEPIYGFEAYKYENLASKVELLPFVLTLFPPIKSSSTVISKVIISL